MDPEVHLPARNNGLLTFLVDDLFRCPRADADVTAELYRRPFSIKKHEAMLSGQNATQSAVRDYGDGDTHEKQRLYLGQYESSTLVPF